MPPDANPALDQGTAGQAGIGTVLARPQFALLTIGQTVSQLGDRLHNMALFALVSAVAAESTTAIEMSKIAMAALIPTTFAPVIGALVDRMNKRLTMVACDFLRALAVASIPWLFHTTGFIWPAYVVAFCVGLAGVFFNSAKMALIPDLVEPDQLMPANAALSTIGRFATVAGIVGGGILTSTDWSSIGWTGYEAGFYLDALSYGISVATLMLIMILSRSHDERRKLEHPLAESAEVVRGEVAHLRTDLRRIVGTINGHHGLRFVFLMVIVLATMAGSIYVILGSKSLLDDGTRGVGFLGGMLAGGMIPGSLLAGTVGRRFDKRWIMILGCLTMGLIMMGGSLYFRPVVLLPIAFLGGLVLAPVMVSMDTMLHQWAPARSRGLVFSTRDLVLGASFVTATVIVSSALAALASVVEQPYPITLFVAGIVVSAAAVAAALTQRHLPAEQPRAA